jgi:hypothetical protein
MILKDGAMAVDIAWCSTGMLKGRIISLIRDENNEENNKSISIPSFISFVTMWTFALFQSLNHSPPTVCLRYTPIA